MGRETANVMRCVLSQPVRLAVNDTGSRAIERGVDSSPWSDAYLTVLCALCVWPCACDGDGVGVSLGIVNRSTGKRLAPGRNRSQCFVAQAWFKVGMVESRVAAADGPGRLAQASRHGLPVDLARPGSSSGDILGAHGARGGLACV